MLLVALRFGLLGAVCCFVSTTPVCVRRFLLFPATLGLAIVASVLCCWSTLVGRLSVLESTC